MKNEMVVFLKAKSFDYDHKVTGYYHFAVILKILQQFDWNDTNVCRSAGLKHLHIYKHYLVLHYKVHR